MSTKLLLGWSLLLLAGCAQSALGPLVVDGQELHHSLVTRKLEDASRLHVPRAVLRDNPHLSTDAEFVEAIARGASQGRLGAQRESGSRAGPPRRQGPRRRLAPQGVAFMLGGGERASRGTLDRPLSGP